MSFIKSHSCPHCQENINIYKACKNKGCCPFCQQKLAISLDKKQIIGRWVVIIFFQLCNLYCLAVGLKRVMFFLTIMTMIVAYHLLIHLSYYPLEKPPSE